MYYIENIVHREFIIWRMYHIFIEVRGLHTLPSRSCGGMEGPSGTFGSLFSSRSCLTKHTQLSVQNQSK